MLPHYQVIYARDYHTAIVAFMPRLLFRRRLILEMNGLVAEEQRLKKRSVLNEVAAFILKLAERLATACSNMIIAVTPQIASHIMADYGCPAEKVKIISNGVNTETFYPIDDEVLLASCRKEFGIKEKAPVVLFVGNLAPWQGVEYLIQSAPAVLREIKDAVFLIIGDGILREEYEIQTARAGVADHFIFAGMVGYEKIPLCINLADVCVLPKRRLKSGYSPIKLYEYMACEKPVVSSRVEGLEFVEAERIGRLTEPEDARSLGRALLDLFKAPQERRAMGVKGRQLAQEKFSWESRVIEIEAILTKLA